jgi:chromosome segregation ATPase
MRAALADEVGRLHAKHESIVRHTSELAKEMTNIANTCQQLDESGTSGNAALHLAVSKIQQEHGRHSANVVELTGALKDLDSRVTSANDAAAKKQSCADQLAEC